MVTTNARNFMRLLNVEVHSGIIVLRESGLTRDEQWERLIAAIDHIQRQTDPENYMINCLIEVVDATNLIDREIPFPD